MTNEKIIAFGKVLGMPPTKFWWVEEGHDRIRLDHGEPKLYINLEEVSYYAIAWLEQNKNKQYKGIRIMDWINEASIKKEILESMVDLIIEVNIKMETVVGQDWLIK